MEALTKRKKDSWTRTQRGDGSGEGSERGLNGNGKIQLKTLKNKNKYYFSGKEQAVALNFPNYS